MVLHLVLYFFYFYFILAIFQDGVLLLYFHNYLAPVFIRNRHYQRLVLHSSKLDNIQFYTDRSSYLWKIKLIYFEYISLSWSSGIERVCTLHTGLDVNISVWLQGNIFRVELSSSNSNSIIFYLKDMPVLS